MTTSATICRASAPRPVPRIRPTLAGLPQRSRTARVAAWTWSNSWCCIESIRAQDLAEEPGEPGVAAKRLEVGVAGHVVEQAVAEVDRPLQGGERGVGHPQDGVGAGQVV